MMSKQAFTPKKGVLVTGAAGFIGSAFAPLIAKRFPDTPVYALDTLTYAGFRDNLAEFEACEQSRNSPSQFVRIDITDYPALANFFAKYEVDTIIHFAAETHVDRSLMRPDVFFHSNVIGTACLLKAALASQVKRFVHISTDEVYGSTPDGAEFDETAPLKPSSPYASSKAGADLAVLSYVHSYDFPALIVRGSNNFGPRQYPEKIIPFFVARALTGKDLPLYGNGENERDWIHVTDFCRGILHALQHGSSGQIYNIGGGHRITNNQLAENLIQCYCQITNTTEQSYPSITYVTDRPGHDLRYRINCDKIKNLGFTPKEHFLEQLRETVQWYVTHQEKLSLQVARDETLNSR